MRRPSPPAWLVVGLSALPLVSACASPAHGPPPSQPAAARPTATPPADGPAAKLAQAGAEDRERQACQDRGDDKGALGHAERALELREAALGPEDLEVARSLVRVGALRRRLGEFHDVEAPVKRALPILERALGADHLEVARALDTLASVPLGDRNYDAAEPLLARALEIVRKHPDAWNDLGATLNDQALVLKGQRHPAKAIPVLEEALRAEEHAWGKDDPHLATVVGNLGESYRLMRDAVHAEPLLVRALALTEQAYGADGVKVGSALNNLASLYHYTTNEYAKAEPLYRRALVIYEKRLGEGHVYTAQLYINLGTLLCAEGDWAQGEPVYAKGMAIFERVLGPGHPEVALARSHLEMLRQKRTP